MDISLDKSTGQYQITAYGNGCITINGEDFSQPLTVSLNSLKQGILPQDVTGMDEKLLKELEIDQFEAVLLGTGESLKQPSWELLEAAQMMRAPLEVMSTAAACRTFTVLASEGRQVLAILYPE